MKKREWDMRMIIPKPSAGRGKLTQDLIWVLDVETRWHPSCWGGHSGECQAMIVDDFKFANITWMTERRGKVSGMSSTNSGFLLKKRKAGRVLWTHIHGTGRMHAVWLNRDKGYVYLKMKDMYHVHHLKKEKKKGKLEGNSKAERKKVKDDTGPKKKDKHRKKNPQR